MITCTRTTHSSFRIHLHPFRCLHTPKDELYFETLTVAENISCQVYFCREKERNSNRCETILELTSNVHSCLPITDRSMALPNCANSRPHGFGAARDGLSESVATSSRPPTKLLHMRHMGLEEKSCTKVRRSSSIHGLKLFNVRTTAPIWHLPDRHEVPRLCG